MPTPPPARPGTSPVDGLRTPDGRYLVVRARLWRAANPALAAPERDRWVKTLMDARRTIGLARRRSDPAAERQARRRVHRAKVALGERGPVWWDDGTADLNRRMVHNTPYADWYSRAEEWADIIDRLLRTRAAGASLCPSEVARARFPRGWRRYLDEVRAVACQLARRQQLLITQRGRVLDPDGPMRGAVRLRRLYS